MQVNELYNQYAYEGYEELESTDTGDWEMVEGQDPVLIAAYTLNETANEYKTGTIQTGLGKEDAMFKFYTTYYTVSYSQAEFQTVTYNYQRVGMSAKPTITSVYGDININAKTIVNNGEISSRGGTTNIKADYVENVGLATSWTKEYKQYSTAYYSTTIVVQWMEYIALGNSFDTYKYSSNIIIDY